MGKKILDSEETVARMLAEGKPISDTITEVIKRMEIGDLRLVGPVPRRTDIASYVKKLNDARDYPIRVSQTRVYPFHPGSGTTIQNCYLLHRVE